MNGKHHPNCGKAHNAKIQEDNISLLDSIEEQVTRIKTNVNTFSGNGAEYNAKIESIRAQVESDSAALQRQIDLIRAIVEGPRYMQPRYMNPMGNSSQRN